MTRALPPPALRQPAALGPRGTLDGVWRPGETFGAALSIAVAIEKMVPGGGRLASVLGVVLIGAGVWRLVGLLGG